MFDFAWSELAVIAVVALVVIGPKDLPRVLRTVGTWVRKARAIAQEFQGSLEQMVREAELDDVRQQIDKAARFNFDEEISKTIDPKGELKSSLSDPLLTNPLTDRPAEAPPPEGAPAEPGVPEIKAPEPVAVAALPPHATPEPAPREGEKP